LGGADEANIRASPVQFLVRAAITGNSIIVGPATLNPTQAVTVYALITRYTQPPSVTANIPDVKLRVAEPRGAKLSAFLTSIVHIVSFVLFVLAVMVILAVTISWIGWVEIALPLGNLWAFLIAIVYVWIYLSD